MKKTRYFSFLLMLCLLFSLALPAFADGDTAERITPANYSIGGDAIAAPELSARSALLADLETGQVYFALNADQRAYPASLTKIMTVLLALEAVDRGEVNLKDEVTAGDDCRLGLDEESSTAGIMPGETMTLENYLYCAMISSANEACNVIASYVAGSISAFVERMNARAAELGCEGTHFMNTHGMPDPDHYTTAADLRRITEAALRFPLFETMSNTLSYTVPATNQSDTRILQNTNGLINPNSIVYPGYLYEGAAGIKTGHTNAAGYCLVSTAEKNTVRLLCIVLGSSARERADGTQEYLNFIDTIALYDWLYNNFSVQTLLSAAEPLRDVAVAMGRDADRVALHAQQDFTAVLPNNAEPENYEREITVYSERDGTTLQAPVKAGDVLGEITISKDGQTLGTVPLVASVDVDLSQGAFLKQGVEGFFAKPVVLIILLVIFAVVVLYLVAYIRYQRRRRARAAELRRRRALEQQRYEAEQDAALRREFEGRNRTRRR